MLNSGCHVNGCRHRAAAGHRPPSPGCDPLPLRNRRSSAHARGAVAGAPEAATHQCMHRPSIQAQAKVSPGEARGGEKIQSANQ